MLPSSCDRRAVEQEKKAAWLHQEGGMPNQGERCSSDARSCWVSVTGTWCQLHVFWKCLVSARPALPREWEVNGIEEGDHRLRGFLGGGRTGGRGGVLHAEHPGPNQGSSHIRETCQILRKTLTSRMAPVVWVEGQGSGSMGPAGERWLRSKS